METTTKFAEKDSREICLRREQFAKCIRKSKFIFHNIPSIFNLNLCGRGGKSLIITTQKRCIFNTFKRSVTGSRDSEIKLGFLKFPGKLDKVLRSF